MRPCAATVDNARDFDVARALENVEGDRVLLKRMMDAFDRQTPKVISAIDAAIAEGDAPGVASAAHKIAGSLGAFGAHAAVDLARRLEALARCGDLAGADAVHTELVRAVNALHSAFVDFKAEAA